MLVYAVANLRTAKVLPHGHLPGLLGPSGEQHFVYGNNLAKAHLTRITEGAPRDAGVVPNDQEVPIGFGVTARSTEECQKSGPEALVVYHQADVGENLRGGGFGLRTSAL